MIFKSSRSSARFLRIFYMGIFVCCVKKKLCNDAKNINIIHHTSTSHKIKYIYMDKKFKNASNRIGVRLLIFLSCFLLMYIFMKFDSKLSITKEGYQEKNIILTYQELSGSIRHNYENESSMKTFHVEFIVVNLSLIHI